MSKEKRYVDWYDLSKPSPENLKLTLKMEVKILNCHLCEMPFRSPHQDLSLNAKQINMINGMGGFPKNIPLKSGYLCSTCWKDIYISSLDNNNTRHIESREKYIKILAAHGEITQEEHEKIKNTSQKNIEDQTTEEWEAFLKRKESD